ncbi:hypothetical protein HMSSN036_94060 [Paenibacillus macerans]|nr:hypothetical protein HMSSN036_94060 [Paenibacillus macerans]
MNADSGILLDGKAESGAGRFPSQAKGTNQGLQQRRGSDLPQRRMLSLMLKQLTYAFGVFGRMREADDVASAFPEVSTCSFK